MQDEMILDRMICGINNEAIQCRLLEEKDTLTLKEAVDIAVSMETVASDARDFTKAPGKTSESYHRPLWPLSLGLGPSHYYSEKGQGQVTAATGACDHINRTPHGPTWVKKRGAMWPY